MRERREKVRARERNIWRERERVHKERESTWRESMYRGTRV